MNKVKILKILNPVLFLTLLGQVVVTLLLKFTGLYQLSDIHVYIGYALIALITLHLILNFDWIKNQFFRKKSS